jgi:hypothetical protein
MKITIAELRKIVRHVLNEQGWVPGRWLPSSGEPVEDEDDLERLGNGGFLSVDVDEDSE